jgi:hypothetical protein
LIDTNGNEVVPLIFDDFDYYPKEDVYKVKKRSDYGFIDIYGKEIISPEFKISPLKFISEQLNNVLLPYSNPPHSKMHRRNLDVYFETLNSRHAPIHLAL